MEKGSQEALFQACQAAYARGRLRWALGHALPVIPMTLLSAVYTTTPLVSLGLGLALAGALVWLLWRGGEAAEGAQAGVIAGALALMIPPLYRVCRHVCVGALCWATCTLLCALVGVAAGVVLGRTWQAGAGPERLLAAGLLATLGGAMGCLELGASGLAAVLLGVFVSGTLTATTGHRSGGAA